VSFDRPLADPALLLFLVINLAHVPEHFLQAIQIFVLGSPRSPLRYENCHATL